LTLLKAIILGIVQGLTEFLPVSSSGHLALAQYILNVKETPLLFDIILHAGTLLAVIIIFWRDIRDIFLAIFGKDPSEKYADSHYRTRRSGRMFALYIIIGNIPTVVIALIIEKYVEKAFGSPFVVSIMLVITGFILWLSGRIGLGNIRHNGINTFRSLLIGIAQGIAALPGISRSGATISTALMTGIDGEQAARYSLLLSVPAILGATIFELRDVNTLDISLSVIIAGALSAFIFGYLAIKFLIGVLRKGHFSRFSYYCWVIGLSGIIAYIIRGL